MSRLTQIAKRQHDQLIKADEKTLEDIANAYRVLYDRMGGNIRALTLAIDDLEEPTQAEIKKLPEYKELIRRSKIELDRFTIYLGTAIAAGALSSISLGLGHSRELISAATGKGFEGVGSSSMKYLLNYLKEDGPLYARLQELTGNTVGGVVQSIMDGVGSGWNPTKIADAIQDSFGGGLTDALRNTRTVQLWSYRDSARANYMASDVVTGWVWFAELDERTCEACIAEHGTIHDLDEQLDGHYNCRCVPIPYVEGMSADVGTGEDWFNSKSEEEQREILGPNKYDALKGGAFQFSDLAQKVPNDIYGQMTTATPLWQLLGSEPPLRTK